MTEKRRRKFRPYSAYKPSGSEWIGELPAHWTTKRLKLLAKINPESLREDSDPDSEVNYVDIGGVNNLGQIIEKETMSFASAPSRARRIVREGDIIVSTVRTYLRAIAPIVSPEPNLIVSTGFAVVRPVHELASGYASYALRAPFFVERVVAESKGVSFPAISELEMATFELPIPPIEEQRAIAVFLDRETARIDALISREEALISLLQAKRVAVVTRAVSKGLRERVPMKRSGIIHLKDIPSHWDEVPMRRLISRIEQGWSPIAEDRDAGDDEWAVIKLGAVSRGNFVSAEHKALPLDVKADGRLEVQDGDFLITRANTPNLVGDVCVVRGSRPKLMLCDLIYRITFRDRRANPQFLAFWFLSRFGRSEIEQDARGTSQSMVKVAQGHIRSWRVPVPPPEEQVEIVDFLKLELGKLEKLISKIQDAIQTLRESRSALISAAVTGKIDVRQERE